MRQLIPHLMAIHHEAEPTEYGNWKGARKAIRLVRENVDETDPLRKELIVFIAETCNPSGWYDCSTGCLEAIEWIEKRYDS